MQHSFFLGRQGFGAYQKYWGDLMSQASRQSEMDEFRGWYDDQALRKWQLEIWKEYVQTGDWNSPDQQMLQSYIDKRQKELKNGTTERIPVNGKEPTSEEKEQMNISFKPSSIITIGIFLVFMNFLVDIVRR